MTDMSKIKVGVIGTGALGRHHARLYAQNPNAEVVGIFDVSPESAAKVGAEFNLPVFDDWKKLAEQCDALSVAVPATLHSKVAIPLMEMGKHVLVEKPIAASAEEAVAMNECAAKNGVVLAVGHTERFSPATDFIDTLKGNVRYIEARRMAAYPPPRPGMHRRGTEVSVVLDLMIHDLDLILTMVGCEVEKIDAVGIPVLSKTEDIASVRIKFVNGAVANVTASRMSPEPMRKFRVFQKDSYASMDYANHCGKIYRRSLLGVSRKKVDLCEKNALAAEIENFVEAVAAALENGGKCVKQPRVTGRDGLKALELAIRITDEIRSYNEKYDIMKLK